MYKFDLSKPKVSQPKRWSFSNRWKHYTLHCTRVNYNYFSFRKGIFNCTKKSHIYTRRNSAYSLCL